MPVTLAMFYQEFIMNSCFYHIDIPGIINLCFYHIVAMHIIIYIAVLIYKIYKSKPTS